MGKQANVQNSLSSTIASLADEMPSAAAGLGLVYAHPIARFEINFSLPLVVRAREDSRKGLSFGVGIEFL
jgi:outer membrane protein insertion porin family